MSKEEKCIESKEIGKYSETPFNNELIFNFLFETETNFNFV